MTSSPVDEGCTDVWVTPARGVDHGRDDTAARWIPTGATRATGDRLWAAVDGCGSRATVLTWGKAPSSTIHRRPYFYDLDVIPAVGECRPRPDAPRHPQRADAHRRESEHRR